MSGNPEVEKRKSTPRAGAPQITVDTSTNVIGNNEAVDPHLPSAQQEIRPGTGGGDKFLHVPGTQSRGGSLDAPLTPSSLGGETLAASSSSHGTKPSQEEDGDFLKPDPGNEAEFEVQDNKFAFSPGQLAKLINPKSHGAFKALGGLAGLEKGLRTNREKGLSLDEHNFTDSISFDEAVRGATGSAPESTPATDVGSGTPYGDRIRVFGENVLPEKKAKTIWKLMWIAFNDKILILLSCAAAISLALGLYQTFGVEHADGTPKVEWVEGVAIIVAILIVVMVGAGNDWQKERQFVKLNKKKEDRVIDITRSGKEMQISVYKVLVGDIVHLKPGDLIPVDGIFISGHGVKCDESSATGESDQMKKTAADEVWKQMQSGGSYEKLDCFIISGSKVLEGIGSFIVTSVGTHSSFGKTMMALREDTDATPLQMKLNNLAEAIAKLGGGSALLLFIVLLIRFLVNLKGSNATADEKGQNFMRILITSITVVVVAVPEGLPLAVTLALAFATTRMLKDKNLVRVLRACETMGNATTVCSDKTGTLTQNKMTVVAGTYGLQTSFGPEWDFSLDEDAKVVEEKKKEYNLPTVLDINKAKESLSEEIKAVLLQSIVANSTAFDDGTEFIGSKTETALLEYARNHLGMGALAVERANSAVVQMIPFDSGRKCMGAVVKNPNGTYRLYVKGASEILLAQCSRIIADPTGPLGENELTADNRDCISEIIVQYATRSLRTIGLVYRDFPQWPPQGARVQAENPTQAEFTDDVFSEMIFFGIVGIQDPLRPGVKEAVDDCRHAGVVVRMVTGDNVMTARAIAKDCGILQAGGIVMEGPKFRQLSPTEMEQVIPRLQVLARSSPEDKRILVKKLKELGETVAVTGDGTNDGPALKTADVGFSMGIAGTEVAKEASAIILMDDNFASIVKAIMWGRAVNDAVKKFLQFQLTVNITAVLTTFVTAVASSEEESVLTAVQLLWVNLIMDTFAALALATDPPTRNILNRKPEPKSAPLITVNMWKMILGQSVYQLVVAFVLHFAGPAILNYHTEDELLRLKALVFNTFVWLQIFNQYNNRRLDNKFNIFEGITRNWFFIGINVIMVGGQVMIIFIGGVAFSVTRLNGIEWAISIVLGAISLPVAVVIRLIPDHWLERIIPDWMLRKDANVYVSHNERFEWSKPYMDIHEELSFLKTIRGGRINQLKWKGRMAVEHIPGFRPSAPASPTVDESGQPQPPPSPGSFTRRRSRSNSAFGTMVAVLPGVVAGGIGGSSPVDRKINMDAIQFPSTDPNKPPKSAPSDSNV